MFPFLTRNLINRIQIAVSYAEEQKRQRDFKDNGFELFSMEIEKWKAYADPRDLDELFFIVSHVTAVNGGFGVTKHRVKYWRRQLLAPGFGAVPNGIILQLAEVGALHIEGDVISLGTNKVDELAQRLALWERYRGTVPYHQIGAANGDNLANRELEHRTWHGNLGNFGVGWSLDVGGGQVLEDWHVETGRAALRTLCGRVLDVSERARKAGIRTAPHRAFSPGRRNDTGKGVHQEIIVPVAKELDCLEIDYHMKKGKGRPIPNTWDDGALYDAKGRKIAA